MSLVNYTLPLVAPVAPSAYLGPQTYGQAVAINSLLYDTPRYAPRRVSTVPSTPNRRQQLNPGTVKDSRDPYTNQYPQRSRHQVGQSQSASKKTVRNKNHPDHAAYDEYFKPEPVYEGKKNVDYVDRGTREDDSKYRTQGGDRKKSVKPSTVSDQQNQAQDVPGFHPQQKKEELLKRPPTYKRIGSTFNGVPEPGTMTSLHAVLDFDDDFDYNYEDDDVELVPESRQKKPKPQVTPIEGPILIKNGTVPVVPLYAHPVVHNGTLVQIPILWTALSLALGFEIHGDIVRGVPCIKRFHQLFCPTAGNTYPIERIERFIDDNKALMKRMYGEFQMSTEYGPAAHTIYDSKRNVKRQTSAEGAEPTGQGTSKADSYFRRHRSSRQSYKNEQKNSGRTDACESKIEIVTPYWASNSAGKIRAIVNTQHFEQAIHQEVCSKVQTKRCVGDCGCEQKYKWHRLLAYDPDNDCKGIFMDWFLFPSCCVCRCAPIFNGN